MFTVLVILLLATLASSEDVIDQQTAYRRNGLRGYKPWFEKGLYTARIVDNTLIINDGPLVLMGCGYYPFFVRALIENTDATYVVTKSEYVGPMGRCYLVSSFSIEYGRKHWMKNLFTIFKIEAYYEHSVVAEAYILAVNSLNKFVYNVEGKNHLLFNHTWSVSLLVYFIVTMISAVCLSVYLYYKKYCRSRHYHSVANTIT